jgi:hypothetical protein
MREAIFNQFRVWQERMYLDLVYCWFDIRIFEECLQPLDSPVRNPDRPCQASSVELLYRSPDGLGILCELLVDDVLSPSAV